MSAKQICFLCLHYDCEELPGVDGNLLARKIKYCLPEIRRNINSNISKLICRTCNKNIEFICKYKKLYLINVEKFEHFNNSTKSPEIESGQMDNIENQQIEDNLEKDSSFCNNYSENTETDPLNFEIEIIPIDINENNLDCLEDESDNNQGDDIGSSNVCETENINIETDSDNSPATTETNNNTLENKKNFHCQTCDKLCLHHSSLIEHNLNTHNVYLCSFYECSESFTNETELIQHKKNHMDFKECLICNEKFLTKDALFEHSEIHTNQLQCILCYKKFRNVKSLKWHQKYHPEYEFECPVCSELFMYKVFFQKHLETHKEPQIFQCEICHKVLKYKQSFASHMKRHTDGCYKCYVCNETFDKRRQFIAHEKIHKTKKILECPQCNKKLFSESGLRTHQKLVHSGQVFECLFCKKEFKFRASLLEHEWKCTNHS